MTNSPTSSITAVDLFCGVGGLTHGLEQAGIDVRLGVDKDGSCAYPYETNNRARFLEADIADVTPVEIQEALAGAEITLLAGCAPCQPFSTYSRKAERAQRGSRRGRGGADDWKLVRTFGNLVMDVNPHLVTMENVPPLADQEIFHDFLALLETRYSVAFDIIECQSIGLPQTRKRLVLVASRLGPINLIQFGRHRTTVRDTIFDLPPISAGDIDPSDALHRASRLSPLNLQRIRASRPGGTWRDWPAELKAGCHVRPSGATYPSVYGRMQWDEPAPTITTQAFGFGNGRFGHPEQDRAISLREAAMLQGFPRHYAFAAPNQPIIFSTMGRLIGNAVPVPLGEAIGLMLQDHVRRAL